MFKRHQYRAPEGDDKGGGGGGGEGDDAAAQAAAAAAAAAAKGGEGGDKGKEGEAAKAAASGLLGDHIANKGKAKEGDGKTGEDGRPADVPEQFWDKDKKAVNTAALLKAHSDTRQALKTAQGNAKGTKVENADGYKYEAPKGLPDHIDASPDDPTVKALREISFKAGLTQEQFATLTTGYFEAAAKLLPAPDLAAEKAKLGENADKVLAAVENWGRGLVDSGIWSPEEFDEIVGLGSTALGLRALNKLREQHGGEQIPVNPGDAAGGEGWSLEDCYAKVGSKEYHDNPTFRAKVDKRFEQLVGTTPMGSSPAGVGVGGRARAA